MWFLPALYDFADALRWLCNATDEHSNLSSISDRKFDEEIGKTISQLFVIDYYIDEQSVL